jgi:hypothetical protein
MDQQKKISLITGAVEKQIIHLLSRKVSGRIQVTVELNVSQGYVASANLRDDSNVLRESIFK